VSGADNQQERLRLEGWVAGFIDGEGCFSVNINRCSVMKLGWQVRPEFVVTQGERSASSLELLQSFFGCGSIYRNTRRDNHREDVLRWCVRRRADLEERVLPFLEVVPLRTAKAADLEKFCQILALMRAGRHLELDGIAEIASIVERMNQRKKSSFLRILRDCTPAASDPSEAKIQSVLHGDMERLAEMSSPLRSSDRSQNQVRASGSLVSNS
jgi:hypothetical protein